MRYQVRRARSSDIDAVAAACRRRAGHQVVLHDVAADDRIERRIEAYQASGLRAELNAPVFVAERHRQVEGYLAIAHLPQVPSEEGWFTDLGFAVDMVRIGKRVGAQPLPGLSAEGYRVRPGGPNDKLFLLNLNTVSAPFTVPARPNRDLLAVGQMYFETFAQLDLSPDNPLLKVFIVEEVASGAPVGQIMLKLGLRDMDDIPVGYIQDIAVHPDHMGHHLSFPLVHEVERYLQRGGIRWLTADISAANPRPLSLCLTYLGFSVQYRRWVKAIEQPR